MKQTVNERFHETLDALRRNTEEYIHPLQSKKADLPLPNGKTVGQILEMLRSILFPGYFGTHPSPLRNTSYYLGATLNTACLLLREQIEHALRFFLLPLSSGHSIPENRP